MQTYEWGTETLYESGSRASGEFIEKNPETTTIEPCETYEFQFESSIPLVPPLDWIAAKIIEVIYEQFKGLEVTWIKIEGYDVRFQVHLPPAAMIAWYAVAIILAILAVLVFLTYKTFGVIERVVPPSAIWLIAVALAAGAIAALIRAMKKEKKIIKGK